tara:strand:+ start:159 stop:1553 length:1395 start_codon:yes stop_codon:yes gene_type:complete
MLYRNIPSITECDSFLKSRNLAHGKVVRDQVNFILDSIRKEISENKNSHLSKNNVKILEKVASHIESLSNSIKRVINATGVVVHTNLGRAPLSEEILEKVLPKLSSYTFLEFNVDSGKRGSRGHKISRLLCSLSGAEDALVVNNNAAAVFLMLKVLSTNAKVKKTPEVILSRGELVEIGGSFRILDILKESGVKIVEIGSTNKCHLIDYEQAITENTVAFLKVHPSNYQIQGYTESVPIEKVSKLAHSHGLLCFHDWGSGSFYKFKQKGLSEYFTVQQELSLGPDLLTFSGDKLLGGIQAGILLGKRKIIHQLKNHPLYRTFRLDKVSISLMEATLEAYLDINNLTEKIPTIRLLEQTSDEILKNVNSFKSKLKLKRNSNWSIEIVKTNSLTGGGALPEKEIESIALVISNPKWSSLKLQKWFRNQSPPVIVRIHEEQIWLDFRTILPKDKDELLSIVNKLIVQ